MKKVGWGIIIKHLLKERALKTPHDNGNDHEKGCITLKLYTV